MSPIPLGGGVGSRRAARPRTLVSKISITQNTSKFISISPNWNSGLRACVVCKSLRQRTTCSPSLYCCDIWPFEPNVTSEWQNHSVYKIWLQFQSFLMYNTERDRGRQVELPLHSHYISGIKAENHILDYMPLYCSTKLGSPGAMSLKYEGLT